MKENEVTVEVALELVREASLTQFGKILPISQHYLEADYTFVFFLSSQNQTEDLMAVVVKPSKTVSIVRNALDN